MKVTINAEKAEGEGYQVSATFQDFPRRARNTYMSVRGTSKCGWEASSMDVLEIKSSDRKFFLPGNRTNGRTTHSAWVKDKETASATIRGMKESLAAWVKSYKQYKDERDKI